MKIFVAHQTLQTTQTSYWSSSPLALETQSKSFDRSPVPSKRDIGGSRPKLSFLRTPKPHTIVAF